MRKLGFFNIIICSVLLFSISYLYTAPTTLQKTSILSNGSYELSDSITIGNSTDLEDMNLPGEGTESNPFYIENVHIQAFNTSALTISEIKDYYIVIRNCIFESLTGFQFVLNITNVSNLKIDNCSLLCEQAPAMNVTDCTNLEIVNSKIDGAGMMFWFCTNLELINNEIGDVYSSSTIYSSITPLALVFSVHVENCSFVKFVDNLIHNTPTHGLFVRYSNNLTAANNKVDSIASWSFYFSRSYNVEIYDNVIRDTGWVPIRLYRSYNCKVTNNTILRSGEWGINLVESFMIRIEKNTIEYTGYTGITLENSTSCTIAHNIIQESQSDGIHIEDSDEIEMINNSIIDSATDGIRIYNACDIEISGCYIENSIYNGINLDKSIYVFVTGCYVAGSRISGIYLFRTNSSTITNTWSVESSLSGIQSVLSNNLTIRNNSVCRNEEYGISLSETESSIIYHNRIGINSQRAIDSLGDNHWNNTDFGNKWHEFRGSDDTPTSIHGSSESTDFHAYQWHKTIPNITSITPTQITKSDNESIVFHIDAPNLEMYWIYVDDIETVSHWGPSSTIRATLNLPVGYHNITIKVSNAFGETNSMSRTVNILSSDGYMLEGNEVIISVILVSSGIIQLVAASLIVREARSLKE